VPDTVEEHVCQLAGAAAGRKTELGPPSAGDHAVAQARSVQ
jgi:hypothetical protein